MKLFVWTLSMFLVVGLAALFGAALLDFDPFPPGTPGVIVCTRTDALAGSGHNRVEFRAVDAEVRVLPFFGIHTRGTSTTGVRFEILEDSWSCGPANQ